MQITEIYRPQANVSFGSQWRGGIGWVAGNVQVLLQAGDSLLVKPRN